MSLLLLLTAVGLLSSCAHEDGLGNLDTPQKGAGFNIQLTIPEDFSGVASATRATSVASQAELEIKSLFVFVFDQDGAYRSYGTVAAADIAEAGIVGNGTATPQVTVPMLKIVDLVETDEIVIILNQAPVTPIHNIASLKKSDIKTYFTLFSAHGFIPDLTFEDPTKAGLPMYGELTGVVGGMEGLTPNFHVKRAVAKVQVKLHANVTTAIAEGVDQIHFIPANVTYQLFQNAERGEIATPVAPALNYAINNTAPITAIDEAATPIAKRVITQTEVADNTTGASYIYEYAYAEHLISAEADFAAAAVDATIYKAGRLAILLKVKQAGAATETFKYYHLALQDKETGRYIDIKRNHNYQVIITSVADGEGFDSATEALNADPSNIEYSLIDNRTGSVSMSNGKYAISIGEQPYAGKSITLDQTKDINQIELSEEVRYLLSPSINELPADIANSISCTSNPADAAVTISPTHLTDATQPLVLSIPKGYEGQINFTITLGELVYNSQNTEGSVVNNKGITVLPWEDGAVADGDMGAALTAPSEISTLGSYFPNNGTVSKPIHYSGHGNRVDVYLPTNAECTTWSTAVTSVEDFATKLAVAKPTWLAAATFAPAVDHKSGEFTFTHQGASGASKREYKIKLVSSNGITRHMTIKYIGFSDYYYTMDAADTEEAKRNRSNAYIIPLHDYVDYKFSIKRIDDYWGNTTSNDIYGGNSLANTIASNPQLKAKILWADFTYDAAKFKVTANAADASLLLAVDALPIGGGNMLVGVTKADGVSILWSWHMWFTDIPMDVADVTNQTLLPNGVTSILDRNLGARSKGGTGSNSYGLYYQWGRKDPFLTDGTLDVATSKNQGSLVLGVTNPTKHYIADNDWVAVGLDKVADKSKRWNNSEDAFAKGTKTIFDPCPRGWRMPWGANWSGFAKDDTFAWEDTPIKGRRYQLNVNAFFPASGWREKDLGSLGLRGNTGVCWSSSPHGAYASCLYFHSGDVTSDNNYNRAYGMSVRPVLE